MIHWNIIENVGMLDDRFFMYCEDEEHSLRLAKNNISITVIPKQNYSIRWLNPVKEDHENEKINHRAFWMCN